MTCSGLFALVVGAASLAACGAFVASPPPPRARALVQGPLRNAPVGEITDPGLLFTQLAGCSTLLGAGFKVTADRAAEEGKSSEAEEGEEKEVDIFRDTAVRYLGYANECGEAFRPLVPGFVVTLSYAVAIAYVSADALSKGTKCAKINSGNFGGKAFNVCAIPATVDVLTFQMLASVIFPGFTINRWVTFVTYLEQTLHLKGQVPDEVYTYLPTAAGLLLIPFIVAPLDNLVELVLEKTLQPFLIKLFPACDLSEFFEEIDKEYTS